MWTIFKVFIEFVIILLLFYISFFFLALIHVGSWGFPGGSDGKESAC